MSPVTPGAADLLVVALDRARQVVMDDEAHIGPIDTHPERHSRHNHVGSLVQVGVALRLAHQALAGPGADGLTDYPPFSNRFIRDNGAWPRTIGPRTPRSGFGSAAAFCTASGVRAFPTRGIPCISRKPQARARDLVLSTEMSPDLPETAVLDRELMNRPRLTDFTLRATSGKLKVLRTMDTYIDQTHWIMTDMPMYAFRVGRPVPPDLATFSQKRLSTGSLTEEDILAVMREYQPEQVLIARFQIPALEEYVQERYTLILSVEFFRLFLRNDLQPVKP